MAMPELKTNNLPERPIADLHMHCIPGVDDGAVDLDMSMDLLQMSYDQGVRIVFCTSHDTAYDPSTRIGYPKEEYLKLKEMAAEHFPDMQLYLGSEIFCIPYFMDEIVDRYWAGEYPTMNRTRFVLIEYPTWGITVEEMKYCINRLNESGFKVIIAHAERYHGVIEGIETIREFKDMNCLIQVNANALVDSKWHDMRNLAHRILEEQLADFIGTDAHRTTHRPPELTDGVNVIYEKCDKAYADAICWENIDMILNR